MFKPIYICTVKKPRPPKKKIADPSTEDKIKKAARKVFLQKGFAATRTRDIAQKADINLALLNYYFRSKEKLFAIIMKESIQTFLKSLVTVFNDERTTFEEKIDRLAAGYIDILTANPDIPLFVLSEIRRDPAGFLSEFGFREMILESVFLRQLQDGIRRGHIAPCNPLHYVANLMGLCVFPFVARPMLQALGGLDGDAFNGLMAERRLLIPQWYRAMTKPAKQR